MAAGIVIGKETLSTNAGVTVEEAMLSAKRYPDAYLFFLNGRPIPMTTPLRDGDVVEALRVASGG
ncbi:MAG: MoaD/ThiS family protein [Methanomassiliicoccaceae archaeon]|jgi:sulfur carrier protein|nr:MoaD/ThiS family protein [Methanomassiliicoccaceae archaeon]